MNASEIRSAILRLSKEDVAALRIWLNELIAERLDEQIGSDLDAGRLDSLITEAEAEYDAGLAKPL
jgi:hypothetical protein